MFSFNIFLIVIIVALFIFNNRFKNWIKSIFNAGMSKVESNEQMLQQSKIQLEQEHAKVNLAQAKIISQWKMLESQKNELEKTIQIAESKAQIFVDKYKESQTIGTPDEKLKEMAIQILDTVTDEKAKLLIIKGNMEQLEPAYNNSQKLAEMTRANIETKKQELEQVAIQNEISQASKSLAENIVSFDINKVNTNTDAVLTKIKQETSLNQAKLDVAQQQTASNVATFEAEKYLAKASSEDAFAQMMKK
jgi:phage shock protein A